MANEKARQRDLLIYEYAILIHPLEELARREMPPSEVECRTAMAKIQGGINAWGERVREYATFGQDVVFNDELRELRRAPALLQVQIKAGFGGIDNARELQERIKRELRSSISAVRNLIHCIPVSWEPELFDANTPFTAYVAIRAAITPARTKLYYFDRYLKPNFFDLFLPFIGRDVSIRLVTTRLSIPHLTAVSDLARHEFTDYQLLEVPKDDIHDRNLRVDDQLFALGPGIDRIGFAISNFGPADSSPASLQKFGDIIAAAMIIHQS